MYTSACVKISMKLGYKIEEVLDHNIDWVNLILAEIRKYEALEESRYMAYHGADSKMIEQSLLEAGIDSSAMRKKATPEAEALVDLKSLGMKLGRPSKTRIIR